MELYKQVKGLFKEEERTSTIAMADMDIVKISIIACTHREEMGFSMKFIVGSFLLSFVVVGI